MEPGARLSRADDLPQSRLDGQIKMSRLSGIATGVATWLENSSWVRLVNRSSEVPQFKAAIFQRRRGIFLFLHRPGELFGLARP